ncbi:hypothetical protein BGZ95_011082 [Linnemannia exigua]|uniref:Cyclin N-terminal domain-containing protein n=1 Tax=Linnemannia exigua TaxID=604196 RepID=A0AAD4HBR7_9FUNG|nr:hypothetical protein BGZ95_011082 [Linnemannia exigua]
MPSVLVPKAYPSAELDRLPLSSLNPQMIDFVANFTNTFIEPIPPSASVTANTSNNATTTLSSTLASAQVAAPTLLSALSQTERAKTLTAAQDIQFSNYHDILARLIVATKYLDDGCPLNKHWSAHPNISLKEDNLIKYQLLALLDVDVVITEVDLGQHALLCRHQQLQQQRQLQLIQQHQQLQLDRQQQLQLLQLQQQQQLQLEHLQQLQHLRQQQKLQLQQLQQKQQRQQSNASAAQHRPSSRSLDRLLRSPPTSQMIDYIVNCVNTVIKVIPRPSGVDPNGSTPAMPPLREFIMKLVLKSNASASTILTALFNLERAVNAILATGKGMHCSSHRIFLACLIVATKYLVDETPWNNQWSAYSTVFPLREVNLMENQLLALLKFDVCVTKADLDFILQDYLQHQEQQKRQRHAQQQEEQTQKQRQHYSTSQHCHRQCESSSSASRHGAWADAACSTSRAIC